MDDLPLPVIDHSRPWRSNNCGSCGQSIQCTGHYVTAKRLMKTCNNEVLSPAKLPSVLLLEFHSLHGSESLDKDLTQLAKDCNLSVEEVRMHLEHLKQVATNCQRGAAKAKETRKRKKMEAVQGMRS